ncbi:MAG TPA: MBL fold metallo-hydrolase [Ruminococcaceae bacterium]|nr:MBL fold metallo-hydrolase [Oscillospiraceae bacterium]
MKSRAQKRKKRWKARYTIITVIVLLFILFANFVASGNLPFFLQSPLNNLNRATGGLFSTSSDGNLTADKFSVHFIDIGQGDSELIWCGGEGMMIDGGPNASDGKAEQYAAAHGITKLKYIVPTHPDEDHVGGLTNVVQKLSVQYAIMTDATANTRTFENLVKTIKQRQIPIIRAKAGAHYTLGSASFTILGPVKEYDDTNDMSIVLKLQYKGVSFLFTGDAPIRAESDMMQSGENLSATVLKVGHHGSKTATSQAFLQAVNPKYAIVSVGKDNHYGLPDGIVLNRLKQMNIQTYRTDEKGTIVMQENQPGKLTIKSER